MITDDPNSGAAKFGRMIARTAPEKANIHPYELLDKATPLDADAKEYLRQRYRESTHWILVFDEKTEHALKKIQLSNYAEKPEGWRGFFTRAHGRPYTIVAASKAQMTAAEIRTALNDKSLSVETIEGSPILSLAKWDPRALLDELFDSEGS